MKMATDLPDDHYLICVVPCVCPNISGCNHNYDITFQEMGEADFFSYIIKRNPLCVFTLNLPTRINESSRLENQIDFCTKCKNYLKVIIDRALPEPIPGFLADILTLNLDVQAKHADLVNMDNNQF